MVPRGVGIASEDQEKLFQHFSQLDNSSTREAEGTGLGLAIAMRIANLFDGDITVESEVGKGSIFTATFMLELESCNATYGHRGAIADESLLILDCSWDRAQALSNILVAARHNTMVHVGNVIDLGLSRHK